MRRVLGRPDAAIAGKRVDQGFTLLELVATIVILGVLAATVLLGMGRIMNQGDEAACNSDARSVLVAVQAFHNNPNNTAASQEFPTSASQLTGPSSERFGGPFLHTWPVSSRYTITLDPASNGHVDVNGSDYDESQNPCARLS